MAASRSAAASRSIRSHANRKRGQRILHGIWRVSAGYRRYNHHRHEQSEQCRSILHAARRSKRCQRKQCSESAEDCLYFAACPGHRNRKFRNLDAGRHCKRNPGRHFLRSLGNTISSRHRRQLRQSNHYKPLRKQHRCWSKSTSTGCHRVVARER
jgi:hypothetical protein